MQLKPLETSKQTKEWLRHMSRTVEMKFYTQAGIGVEAQNMVLMLKPSLLPRNLLHSRHSSIFEPNLKILTIAAKVVLDQKSAELKKCFKVHKEKV